LPDVSYNRENIGKTYRGKERLSGKRLPTAYIAGKIGNFRLVPGWS
jgi:hypothetical protein